MALFHSRRVTPEKVVIYLVGGFGIGTVIGYIFMATAHTMLEIRADSHYGVEPVKGQGVARKMMETAAGGVAGTAADAALHAQQQLPRAADAVKTAAKTAAAKSSGSPTKGDTIHTLCTSNGSPYLNFQNRIMYGTYKLVQKMPGGEKLVAFTRILHRQTPDVLMDEVPTFRANPLTPACDTWCDFPVADRPNAVRQWIAAAEKDPSMIQAPWLLMIETDYVWLKPVAAPLAESSEPSLAFPFGYIQPTAGGISKVMRKMYPAERGPLSDVPNSGPAPVLMRWQELFKIAPDWERLTAHIENDPESKQQLGWVREMYAWSVGAALQSAAVVAFVSHRLQQQITARCWQGVKFDLQLPPKCKLIAQPPADLAEGDAAMLHYTWGSIWKDDAGKEVWSFDKRFYTDAKLELEVPLIKLPPRLKDVPVLKQQDGIQITQKFVDIYDTMINQMNRAIKDLPVLSRPAQ